MKRLILIAVAALSIPASLAMADTGSVSTETIASRVASGKMSMAAVYNFLSGSDLTYEDVQGMTLAEVNVLVQEQRD